MKKLPLGIQTFSEIITEDYLYVDKTREIYKLIDSGKYFFLSRPRRFGKSLLVSTLKEIFSGNQDLFKGLYIHDRIEWKKHPVVHIDFSGITFDKSTEVFEQSLCNLLDKTAKEYDTTLQMSTLKDKFIELIEKLGKNEKVVLLVDEYDKPIIDFVTNREKAKANRDVLRNFYAVVKQVDNFLRFAFFTGVSKFSKVSVFSGINNILDITVDQRFSSILGICEEDLTGYFSKQMVILAKEEKSTLPEIKKRIKYWYNGYSWDGINHVYNPTSVLSLFAKNQFSNYWFATGTPTFLVKLIREKKMDIASIENKLVGEYTFESFDVDNIEIYSLLFQAGYLTVSEVIKKRGVLQYLLKTPNFEVRESLLNYLLASFSGRETAEIQPIYLEMLDHLEDKKIDRFLSILTSLFAGIPYNLHIKDEKYYHSLCYMILTLMGANVDLEVLSDKGRVDAVLTFDEMIYVIEFKMGSAREAMAQIRERRYHEQFLNLGKKVFLLGVGGFREKSLEYELTEIS